MKKKTLLISLLAAVSAVSIVSAACKTPEPPEPEHTHAYTQWNSDANKHWKECPDDGAKDSSTEGAHVDANKDGKCDDCNRDVPLPHEHSYTAWKYDDDKHWKECPADNTKDATTEAAHKDTNNDGKCDDGCGFVYSYSVTFNMHGYGTAPDAQTIKYGGKVKEPTLSAEELEKLYDEDGVELEGWYLDSRYTQPFDFDEDVITSATVLHAHWVDADYIANAITLTLDTPSMKKFEDADRLYYTFTATDAGRYVLQVANNGCTYSVNAKASNRLINVGTQYYFTLSRNETIGILAYKPATDWNDDTLVTMQVSTALYEPMPEEGYKSGTYTDDYYTVVFERGDDGRGEVTLSYSEVNETVAYNYLDGAVRFSITFAGIGTTDYTLTWTGEDEFTLAFRGGSGRDVSYVLELDVPVDPIDIEKLAGKYEFANIKGNSKIQYGGRYINEVDIFEDGSGYIITNASVEYFTVNPDEDYDAKNKLHWGDITISVTLDENGEVESIKVTYSRLSAVYNRTGDAVELPTVISDLEVGVEYVGGGYTLKTEATGNTLRSANSQYPTYDFPVYIIGVDGDKYTIINGVDDKIYVLELVKEEDDVTAIRMYQEDGTTLVATLTIPVAINSEPLPTDGDEVRFSYADSEDGKLYFEVVESGLYHLYVESGSVTIGDDDEPLTYEEMSEIYLSEGTILCVAFVDEDTQVVLVSEKIANYEYLPIGEEIRVRGTTRYYEVRETGKYKFAVSATISTSVIYYPDGDIYSVIFTEINDGKEIPLTAGGVILVDAVYQNGTVTFTVTEVTGSSSGGVVTGEGTETSPYVVPANGVASVDGEFDTETTYYFTFTAPKADEYLITVTHTYTVDMSDFGWGLVTTEDDKVYFKANNEKGGYDFDNSDYEDVYFGDYGVLTLTLTEDDLTIDIVILQLNKDADNITVTIEPVGGWDEPIVLEYDSNVGNYTGTIDSPDVDSEYHVIFTAPEAGRYRVQCTYFDSFSEPYHNVHFVINDVSYGFDRTVGDWGSWVGGCSADEYWAIIEVSEGNLTVDIYVDIHNMPDYNIPDSIMVSVAPEDENGGEQGGEDPEGTFITTVDIAMSKTEVELPAGTQGSYTIILSGDDISSLWELFGQFVKLYIGDSDDYIGLTEGNNFTATIEIPAGTTKIYLEAVECTPRDTTVKLIPNGGNNQDEGVFSTIVDIKQNEAVEITLDEGMEGTYIITLTSDDLENYFYFNDITLKVGDTIVTPNLSVDNNFTATITIPEGVDKIYLTGNGSFCNGVTVTLTPEGNGGSAVVEDGTEDHPFLIQLVRGSYTHDYDGDGDIYYQFDGEDGPYTISVQSSMSVSVFLNGSTSPLDLSQPITLHNGDIICVSPWAPYQLSIYPASVD